VKDTHSIHTGPRWLALALARWRRRRALQSALVRQLDSGPPSARYRTLATVPDLAGAPGSWVQVMLAGAFTDPRYGDFVIDRAYMDHLVRNFTQLDLPVPIDRDHSPYTDGTTAAMGWVKQLQRRDDDTLWAYVLWTPEGVRLIESGEYRYFSPEFIDDYADKHGNTHGPTLLGGGLTNRPFLTGMKEVSMALHSAQALASLTTDQLTLGAGRAMFLSAAPPNDRKENRTVDRTALITLYGLSADATDEQIMAAATAARQAQLASAAPAPAPTPTPAPAAEPTPEQAEVVTQALARAEAAMGQLRDAEISAAVQDGRLAPVLREHIVTTWDREYAATGDVKETRAMLAAMPKVLRTASTGAAGGAGAPEGEQLPDDAPRSARVLAKARELTQARQGLSLRDAMFEANALVPEDRPHVLQAQREAPRGIPATA